MEIIPVINCGTLRCFRDRVAKASRFSKKLHVDVERKPFVDRHTAVCLRTLKRYAPLIRFQAHLMVLWSRRSFGAYLRMPFQRIYVHIRAISGSSQKVKGELVWALEEAKKHGKELGVVCEASRAVPVDLLKAAGVGHVLVLAVRPGVSGQAFNPKALEVIAFLKKKLPDVTITVDGGVEPALLRKLRGAGAVVSGSYIWESEDPPKAYADLRAS